jgi:hypothetical protein
VVTVINSERCSLFQVCVRLGSGLEVGHLGAAAAQPCLLVINLFIKHLPSVRVHLRGLELMSIVEYSKLGPNLLGKFDCNVKVL